MQSWLKLFLPKHSFFFLFFYQNKKWPSARMSSPLDASVLSKFWQLLGWEKVRLTESTHICHKKEFVNRFGGLLTIACRALFSQYSYSNIWADWTPGKMAPQNCQKCLQPGLGCSMPRPLELIVQTLEHMGVPRS